MDNPFAKLRRARHFTGQIYSSLLKLDDSLEDKDIDMDMQIISLTDINVQVLCRKLSREKVKLRFKIDWDASDDKYHIFVHEAPYGGKRELESYSAESMLDPNNTTKDKIREKIETYIDIHVKDNS